MTDSLSVSEPNPPPQLSASEPQPVRIHFPDRFLTIRTHGNSSRSSSVSFTSPAQPMLHSRSGNRISVDINEGRRRIRSLGPDHMLSGIKNTSPRHYGSRRKKNLVQGQSSPDMSLKADPTMSDFEPSAFSDEYDLSHEDSKILQDVQRALHLQSRRRERMLQQLHSTPEDLPPSTDTPMNMSTPCASTSTAPHSSPQYLQVVSLPSEVDFSPSTRSVPLHPVPLSSNGGATLDWTGSQSEEEKPDRRWSISRGKRKAKERMLPASRAISEKQEALFTDRISRIRAEASPPTVRKAAIVSEQLGRRYNILYSSMASGDPVDLVQIARWHASLGTQTQAWIDSAEPLTWLKHLLNRRGKRRSQWHVTALIVEEYIKAKKNVTSSTPVPQSPTALSSFETPPSQYSLKSPVKQLSGPPSDSSPGTSLSRARSLEGYMSLSPPPENFHNTLFNSQARGEGRTRKWRHSIPAFFETGGIIGTPSPYHHRNSSGGLSPASSRLYVPDIIYRFRRNPAESDEGSSSPFGSQSDDQNHSATSRRHRKSKQKRQSHLSESQFPQGTAAEIDISNGIRDPNVTGPSTSIPAFPSHSVPEATVLPEVNITDSQPVPSRGMHLYRSTSLPVIPNIPPIPAEPKGELDEEGQLEMEYDLKLRTLEELRNHNHRLRHRMQRVSVVVRDYELVCSSAMPALGIAYRGLPMELLDTFSHDPSAVTSRTRKRHGWRVVEDIHARVLRQREILTNFLSGMETDVDVVSIPDNVLDKPIFALMEKLQEIERERGPLQQQADEVSQMLMAVKASHSIVKEEFNDALSNTSVVYPELSHIIALEESYKDQYQQVWELGMDALTFILDKIAPFWRSYGKIIGEDMQDFIIIPWYRNGFTGESKRYLVQSVPHRSFRHWIALFCLCTSTFFITFLQARAAITFTWHYRLLWIDNQAFRWAVMPFFWVVILVQWFALILGICILMLYVAVVAWWLGWLIGICT